MEQFESPREKPGEYYQTSKPTEEMMSEGGSTGEQTGGPITKSYNVNYKKKSTDVQEKTEDLKEQFRKLSLEKKIADLEEEKDRKNKEKELKDKEEKEEKERKKKEEARVRLNRASIVKTSFKEKDVIDKKILGFIKTRQSIPTEFENRIKEVEEQIKKKEVEKVEKEATYKIKSVFKRRKERQKDEEKYEKERQERKIESDRQKSKEELRAAEEVENDFYYSLKPSRDVNVVSKQLGRKIVNASINKTYDILALFDTIPDEREDLEQSKIKAETKQAEAEAKQAEVEAKVRGQEGELAAAETEEIKSSFGMSVVNEPVDEEDAASKIQKTFRKKQESKTEERKDFKKKREAAIKIQSLRRGRKGRTEAEKEKDFNNLHTKLINPIQ